jgi:hypothetical protein
MRPIEAKTPRARRRRDGWHARLAVEYAAKP